jgi:PrtD family type I secretion system ABC transporter
LATLADVKRRIRSAVLAVAVFSLFINLLMFVSPLYMLQVYDRVLTSRNESTLVMLTLLAVAALALYGALEALRSRVLVRMGGRLDALLAQPVFRTVFRSTLRDQKPGHGQSLRDLDQLRDFLAGPGLPAICDAPWVPLFLGLIFLFHPVLGAIATAAALAILVLALANEYLTRRPLQSAAQISHHANSFVETALRNTQAAAAMGMLGNLERHWDDRHRHVLARQARASDRSGAILATSKALRMVFQIAILGAGAYLVLHGATTPGAMIAASIVMGRALAPVEQAVGQWRGFVGARGAYARLRRTLAENEPPDRMPLPAPRGDLAADGAVIVPPGTSTPVVKGASFELAAGQMLGVIGPSGSGKSTLARGLIGLWPVAKGSIRLDGAQIDAWDGEELGRYLGYLPQDIELFDGTVAQNIARFSEIDERAVVAAARLAGVHDTILALADGYDTQIGASGQALSGGQQRAVGFARAVYGDVRLVVLDEPNANLDSAGEQQVLAALAELKARGVTTVVITHRPQLLASADRIVSLKDGVVVSNGTRDEVLQKFVAVNGQRRAKTAVGEHQGR